MAYSNWGGKVYLDEVAKHENCDQPPNSVLYVQKACPTFWHALFDRHEHGENFMRNSSYHAIVGDDKSGFLVFLYKSGCSGIYEVVKAPNGLYMLYQVHEYFACYDEDKTVTIDGVTFVFEGLEDPETISVEFTDSLGRHWLGMSGYCIGEGHQDWD